MRAAAARGMMRPASFLTEAIRCVLPRGVLGPLESEHERLERSVKIVADFYVVVEQHAVVGVGHQDLDQEPKVREEPRDLTVAQAPLAPEAERVVVPDHVRQRVRLGRRIQHAQIWVRAALRLGPGVALGVRSEHRD